METAITAMNVFFGMPNPFSIAFVCFIIAHKGAETLSARSFLFLFCMTTFIFGYLWYNGIDNVAARGTWEVHRISENALHGR
jgi:hypothetical protein